MVVEDEVNDGEGVLERLGVFVVDDVHGSVFDRAERETENETVLDDDAVNVMLIVGVRESVISLLFEILPVADRVNVPVAETEFDAVHWSETDLDMDLSRVRDRLAVRDIDIVAEEVRDDVSLFVGVTVDV